MHYREIRLRSNPNPQGPLVTQVARCFTDAERLSDELPRWDAATLGPFGFTPMQSRAWIIACAETFRAGADLRISVVEDGRGVIAVAPLVTRPGFPGTVELLGVRELSEPTDFVYRDLQALTLMLRLVGRGSRPVILNRVPDRSPSIQTIRQHFRRSAVILARPDNSCPYIDLRGAAADPDALLSASLRSDLRRAQRKAEALGKLTFEIHAPKTAEAFLPLFEEAIRVEGAGWKGRDGSALAVDQRAQAFFRRYGILASEEGALRLALLRINGVPAAMQYAVQWNGALWLLKVGYDEQFSKCSPGLLLMQHTLRDAVAQGLRSYEFLGSAEPWTQRWTNAETTTVRLAVYPVGLRGMLSLSRDAFRRARRKLAARLAARGKKSSPAEHHPSMPSPQHA